MIVRRFENPFRKLVMGFGGLLADRIVDRLWVALEDRNALPLPTELYDVVCDDPDMAGRHEYRGLETCTPKAAAVMAYRRAMVDEGFRCEASHPAGDQVTLELARELSVWCVVHASGEHPGIAYREPSAAVGRV